MGAGWKDRGGPAIWGLITVDTERGLVFLPTGNPGGSFYGGDRPGDNLYSVSVLALDANTGAYKWHYQTTRHDVFDADLAAAPALIDVVQNGRRIPAVAQITKMGGMLFILDRLTGKPIFGVEERKVPASHVPGEKASPTQPIPLKPAPWARLGMTKADLTKVTPESNRFCTEWWEREQMYNDGPYTPYGAKGVSVVFSGTVGGGNWGGVAFNPQLGYVFVNTSNLATLGRMVPDTTTRAVPQRSRLHAILGRQPLSLSGAAVGRARRRQREHRRHRVEGAARDLSGARREGHSAHGHAESRRPDRHGERPGVHRRHEGSPLPRVRREDRQGVVVRGARGAGRRHADDVHGEERHAVRGRRGGRSRRHRSRRHGEYPQKLVAFALSDARDASDRRRIRRRA